MKGNTDLDKQLAECCEKFPSLCEGMMRKTKSKKSGTKEKKLVARKPVSKNAEKKNTTVKKEKVSVRKPARKTPNAVGKSRVQPKSPKKQSESLQSCDPMNIPRYVIVRRAMGCMVKNVIKRYEVTGKAPVLESQIVKEVLNCLRKEAENEKLLRNRIKFTINAAVVGKTLTKHPDGTISLGPRVKRACPPQRKVKVEKDIQVNNSSKAVRPKQTKAKKSAKKPTKVKETKKKSTKPTKTVPRKIVTSKKKGVKTVSKKKPVTSTKKTAVKKSDKKSKKVTVKRREKQKKTVPRKVKSNKTSSSGGKKPTQTIKMPKKPKIEKKKKNVKKEIGKSGKSSEVNLAPFSTNQSPTEQNIPSASLKAVARIKAKTQPVSLAESSKTGASMHLDSKNAASDV